MSRQNASRWALRSIVSASVAVAVTFIVTVRTQATIATTASDGSSIVARSPSGIDEARSAPMPATRPLMVRGTAFLPDGTPIESAVIVSAAGGQAVSGPDGSFALDVEVPMEAESLGVTVVASVGGVNYTASTLANIATHDRAADVGGIVLRVGGDCEPAWIPTFGAQPDLSSDVNALTVFDDGSGEGPALYVGGEFLRASGTTVNYVAKWNGSTWSALGSGMSHLVRVLTVFDDGTGGGPALYAGGNFITAGGATVNRIARWNGTTWAALGSGMNANVNALTVFDDGSGRGPALYAGGSFATAGGVAVNRIARWNGSTWSALGNGVSSFVSALTVFDDGTGSGPALYAGGGFITASGTTVNRIAKWNGSTWSALGSGMNNSVTALVVFDDGLGGGPALYAGGSFATAGGVTVNKVAKWNGSAWSSLGGGLVSASAAYALVVFDDGLGAGPALYVGGGFHTIGGIDLDCIARWNGAAWSSVGGGLGISVNAFAVFDDGTGRSPALYVGGSLSGVYSGGPPEGTPLFNIAKWDGSAYSTLDHGLNNNVNALAVFDDGSEGGPALYAGGRFLFTTDGATISYVARWNGSAWAPLGDGLNSWANALAVFDDGLGGGPALYAGGRFTAADGIAAYRIAKWNGVAWSPVGAGMFHSSSEISAEVHALSVYDDGSGVGASLIAGGRFTTAGETPARHIAKWNGLTWTALGSGIGGQSDTVQALTVFDDGIGDGPALYAGGNFITAGGIAANRIAKWNGSTWSALGSGMNTWVYALTSFDDGSGDGPSLYAGGSFVTAGGITANRIARWNGSAWSALGSGLNNTVLALTTFDDGSGDGPALYAAGGFTTAGGSTARYIAKWSGSTWSSLGNQTSSTANVLAVSSHGSGGVPSLYVGGTFETSPAGDGFVARRQGCAVDPECRPADINCDGAVDGSDLAIVLGQWGGCFDCEGDINGDGVVDGNDLAIVLGGWTG